MATAQVVKVLVVNDNYVIQGVYKMFLVRFGFKITEAENGKVAVDHFRDGNEFDLVLMDKEMPKMDGVKATRTLKERGVHTKIVAVTGDESAKGAFLELGPMLFSGSLQFDRTCQLTEEFQPPQLKYCTCVYLVGVM